MAAVAEHLEVSPTLDEARALTGDHNLIPVTHSFIEDCETPVSAFLKLRGSGPAFLLESAEQGQRVGRWSFIGYKPRSVVRWSLADGGDPYAIAADHASRHRQAPLPGLERTIAERAASGDTAGSYTAQLLADPAFAGEKVREEAEEVARAAREETDDRVAEEAADVLYHLTVLLRTRGLELADAERVLLDRRR